MSRKAEYKKLQAAHGLAHETNFSLNEAELLRELYAAKHTHLRQVVRAMTEGVLSVTVQTRTGSVEVPVGAQTGFDVGLLLAEMVGQHLADYQNKILSVLAEAENEQADADGTSDRARAFALCMPQQATMKAMPAEAAETGKQKAAA